MATAVAEAIRRNSSIAEGLAFATQMLIAVGIEIGDDVGRGFVSQHGSAQGVRDAHDIVAFEVAHGFWIEPAWQTFFMQTHRLLAFTVTWTDTVRIMNGIYIFGHVFVTLGVALWVYAYRRRFFALFRNVLILANVFALLVYETFPVAPPRMTTGLWFDHHPFTFQDTLYGMVSAGQQLVGTRSAGYNEFSAMPSVHMVWALLVAAAVVLLARPLWAKALGALYPGLMLTAVVVTANHYIMDAVGAVLVLIPAGILALAFECWRGRLKRPGRTRREASATS